MDEISNQINTLIIKRDRKLFSKMRKDNNLKSLNKNACFDDIESEYNQTGNQDEYVDNTSMPGISEIDKINKTSKRGQKQPLGCTINQRFLNRPSSKLE